MPKFDRFHKIILGCAVAVVVAVGAGFAYSANCDAKLASLNETLQRTEKHAAKLERANSEDAGKNIEIATGASMSRIAEDSAVIESIMTAATTWDDVDSYRDSRGSIITKYGVDPESQFLSEFMPAPVEYKNSSGQTRNTIDDSGAVTKHNETTVYCTGIGNEYNYLVETKASSTVGDATRYATYTVLVTTDDAGSVSDIYAIEVVD